MIKVGDLVTPSSLCKTRSWWENVAYLSRCELIVTNVSNEIISFHDPIKGTRNWHISDLTIVPLSLENE